MNLEGQHISFNENTQRVWFHYPLTFHRLRGSKVYSYSFKFNSKWCNFCIQCPNSIKLFGRFVLSFLVCVVKFSYQSKKLWVIEKNFSRRFNFRCVFCNFSCYFFDILKPFCKHNESIQWYFFHQCVWMLVLHQFLVQFFFIWVSLEIELHIQMCG